MINFVQISCLESFFTLLCTTTSSLLTFSPFSFQLFSSKQRLNVLFQIPLSRVSNEDNLAISVDEDYVGYTLGSVVRGRRRTCAVEVLHFLPLLGFDVLHYGFHCLVYRDAHDAHFISPFGAVVFKHFLVVSHRFLARRAPGGPEINQDHLTSLVRNRFLFLGPDVHHVLYQGVVRSNRDGALDVCSSSSGVDASEDFLGFGSEGLQVRRLRRWHVPFYQQNFVILL